MLSCVDCSARPSAFSDAAGHTAVIKHSTGTKIRINLGKEAAEMGHGPTSDPVRIRKTEVFKQNKWPNVPPTTSYGSPGEGLRSATAQ